MITQGGPTPEQPRVAPREMGEGLGGVAGGPGVDPAVVVDVLHEGAVDVWRLRAAGLMRRRKPGWRSAARRAKEGTPGSGSNGTRNGISVAVMFAR